MVLPVAQRLKGAVPNPMSVMCLCSIIWYILRYISLPSSLVVEVNVGLYAVSLGRDVWLGHVGDRLRRTN
jgi:hypothetical protein